jgi:uncharacterized membrane protein YhaH (DUF805 family)/Tfp pilus assembly protein PilE
MDEIQQASEIRFFDASSRIGRVRYLAYPWGLILMLIPVFIVAGITVVMHLAVIGALLFIAAEIFALVMSGVFVVRRFHDFDWSGWWSLIYWALQVWSLCLTISHLITAPLTPQPLSNFLPTLLLIVFFLIMVLVPGTQGANRFGPMPPPNSTWVVVGAWSLLLIPFLLGVLAAIAIPAYQDYIARSQTSEGIQLAGGAEVGVSEYYQQNKAWPDRLESVYAPAAENPAGRYVATVSGAGNGRIYGVTSTMKAEGVNRNIAGKSVEIWTTDGGDSWHCGPAGINPVDPKFLPASCRDGNAP